MASSPVRRMNLEIHGKERVFDGFFKIDKLTTTHERYDGKPSAPRDWLVFERGDAVAVVLYKIDTQEIVLVRQFRAPTLKLSFDGSAYLATNDGQLDETVAGMPKDESHVDCAVRETLEETGYRLKPNRLEKIAEFWVSPGGTSERIFLYFAQITDADRDPARSQQIGGVSKDGESTLVRHIPISAFFADMLDPNTTIDSKTLIASMLLRNRLTQVPDAATQTAETGAFAYELKAAPTFSLVLRTGDMSSIDDVDAWINSENTDMEMDRFANSSVSARIRYWGAAKDHNGRVIEDTVAEALRKSMRGRYTSNIGTVHDTTPGDLAATNGVKRLFHVASVQGVAGKGAQANPAHIDLVVRSVLDRVEKRNQEFGKSRCASALMPMVGTGEYGLAPEVAFPTIVRTVIAYFNSQKKALDRGRRTVLRSVHVSAFRQRDADYAIKFLDSSRELVRRF